MKKCISMLFCFILMLSMVACSQNGTTSQTSTSETESQESSQVSSSESTSSEDTSSAESSDTQATGKLADIKNKGELVVGVEATFPPFESFDPENGTEIIGFDIDVMNEVAKDLGVTLVVKDMEFSGIVPSVQTGKIDLAPGITPTEDRKEMVDFSEEYCASKLGLVVREDDDSIKTVDDLKGKVISAQLGSLADKQLTAVLGSTPKTYNKHDEALLAVKNGTIDGHVLDGSVGNTYADSMGGLKVIEIPELNEGLDGLACIVAKGETDLLDSVNGTITRLQESGEMDKLMDKWHIFK